MLLLVLGRCSQPLTAEEDQRRTVYPLPREELAPELPPGIDLAQIKARGKLIALTSNSSISYFIYKGQPMGFEFEMLQRFASSLGVRLELMLIEDTDRMFEILNSGKADLIANNLAVTKERQQFANFSTPYNFTRQVLVQRKPKYFDEIPASRRKLYMVTEPQQLVDKPIYVNRQSNYYQRLRNLEEEMGADLRIELVPGNINAEKLIRKVAEGEIDYTVSEDNLARINTTYYPNLDIEVQLSFPQQVAWAVRKESSELLKAINTWFEREQHTARYNILFNKYFKQNKRNSSVFEVAYSSIHGGAISDYDSLFRAHADIVSWDWRLLAALSYQESRFNPRARSWAGAFGLMQFMPATAAEFGIDSLSSASDQIRAGALYLSWLNDYWQERIPDDNERLKFVLASYNAGLGHVTDAMNLAVELDLNPFVWDNNVAECILLKSQPEYFTSPYVKYGYCRGEEPFHYVRNILSHYAHYRTVVNAV